MLSNEDAIDEQFWQTTDSERVYVVSERRVIPSHDHYATNIFLQCKNLGLHLFATSQR